MKTLKMQSIRPKCGIDKCSKQHYAKGYCQAHYNRVWQSKSKVSVMNPVIGKSPFKRPKRSKCSLNGCGEPHYARKLCQKHYNVTRTVTKVGEDERGCEVKGCSFKHSARGLCRFHYNVLMANSEFENIKAKSQFEEAS